MEWKKTDSAILILCAIAAIVLALMLAPRAEAETDMRAFAEHAANKAAALIAENDAQSERETRRQADSLINERRIEEETKAAEIASQAVYEDMTSWQAEYYPQTYYEPTYSAPSYDIPTDGLTQQGGVNYYEGRTETYYSSNVLYHYRTPEWSVDDEGFYKDSEGRYVVAASDMAQGTTFEGSKGECVVLDSGCDAGVTDYYVAW